MIGVEARGFIFGPPIALAIGAKFIPLRKPRKLPGEVISENYVLEYGTDCLQMHVGAVQPGERALVVDDLIATGGTLCAAISLLGEVISENYVLEYGTDCLQMHVGAVQPGERALVVDDLIATGGTLCAAISLLERAGAEVVECACVIELPELKVKTTSPKKYSVRPNMGVVPPKSTISITVTMQAHKEAPPDLQCKDKFLVQSVVADDGATTKDITAEMFNKAPGKDVEEFKLRVVYIPANPPSPVPEESEEGISPRSSVLENEAQSSTLFDAVSRSSIEASTEQSHEDELIISKLTEEKNHAIQQNKKLRQELRETVGSCEPPLPSLPPAGFFVYPPSYSKFAGKLVMEAAAADGMGALGELEALQTCLLQRIAAVELSLQTQFDQISSDCAADGEGGETTEARLSAILRARGVDDFAFKRVPADYYDRPIEVRRDILGAPSVEHLCKSIVLVNTQALAGITDCSDRNNSKYYVVVIQYAARLNAENIKNFLYTLNNSKISKKKFNMRLAPEEESLKLTGFVHNAVTCIGMETDIPVTFNLLNIIL
ncbi:Phosphoribosyl transferase domain [Musa troglodytarum]|uniref:adenine phosphoribosyltransferase n=1 Tax=Musa troglodytarum TaxID=320322 RepID=A0A9E7F479_9LILI|nr:Phosphoribosyl transferase domain [Musa troglodytarum]